MFCEVSWFLISVTKLISFKNNQTSSYHNHKFQIFKGFQLFPHCFFQYVGVCVCVFFSKVFKIPSLAAWMGISPPAPRVAPELVLQSSTLHHRPGPRNNTPHPQETRRVDEAAAKVPPKFGPRNWKRDLCCTSLFFHPFILSSWEALSVFVDLFSSSSLVVSVWSFELLQKDASTTSFPINFHISPLQSSAKSTFNLQKL